MGWPSEGPPWIWQVSVSEVSTHDFGRTLPDGLLLLTA